MFKILRRKKRYLILALILTLFVVLLVKKTIEPDGHTDCERMEPDAYSLMAGVMNYYAIPNHSHVKLPSMEELNHKMRPGITATLSGSADEEIVIIVTDETGCSNRSFAYVYSNKFDGYASCWLEFEK